MIQVEKAGLLALTNRLRGKNIIGTLTFGEVNVGDLPCLVVSYQAEELDKFGHDIEESGQLLVVGESVVDLPE